MKKRGALLPDVDERGLQPGEDPGDLPEDDVPDAACVLVARPLEVKLGDDAVLDEGNAGFFGFYTDYEEILGHDGCFPALALACAMSLAVPWLQEPTPHLDPNDGGRAAEPFVCASGTRGGLGAMSGRKGGQRDGALEAHAARG